MRGWDTKHLAEQLQIASLDTSYWPAALDEISCAAGGVGTVLFSNIDATRSCRPPCSADLVTVVDTYMRDGWNTRDERFRCMPTMVRRGIAVDDDAVSVKERSLSPFYQEFLRRNGLGSFALVGFKAGNDTWALSIQRAVDQKPFDRFELRRLLALRKPISDAATLSRQFGLARVLGISDALELTRQPAIIFDIRENVLAINSLAENLVGGFFDIRQGKLCFRDRQSQMRFATLLGAACASAAPVGPSAGTTIVIDEVGRRVPLTAIELHGWARFAFSHAKVLLLIGPTMPKGEEDIASVLKVAFSLTTAEARFAVQLLGGCAVADIARRLAISYETARSHLRSIFSKTGTHKQGQLTGLLIRTAG